MNYMLIVIATLGRRAKSVGVHKCNGANNGNIFSMFMMETGIIVLVSILVCAFIIFNARDLIEDLLSVRLASLFTWELCGYRCWLLYFYFCWQVYCPDVFFTYSCHTGIPSLY